MSGLGLGLGQGLGLGLGQGRPMLARSTSMYNADDLWQRPSNTNYFTHLQGPTTPPTTPHEPLSLNWLDPEISLPSSNLALTGQQESDEDTAGASPSQELPSLPALPPLDMLPTLSAEVFHRPIPEATSTNHVLPSKVSKKLASTPVMTTITPLESIAASRKRPVAIVKDTSVNSVNVNKLALPPPRKKRRGQRAGTYQCLVDGELFDCPFHYDMVPKSIILSLLTRQ